MKLVSKMKIKGAKFDSLTFEHCHGFLKTFLSVILTVFFVATKSGFQLLENFEKHYKRLFYNLKN